MRGGEAFCGVGGLDLLAADAEDVHDRVEVGHVDGGVGRLAEHWLGVVGDAEAGGVEHVEVVGAVADRDHRREGYADIGGELAQCGGLAGAVDDVAHDAAGQLAVDDLELVGAGVVDAEVGGEAVGDLAEAARHDREAVAQPAQRANHRADAGGEHDRLVHLVEHLRVEALEPGHAVAQRGLEVEIATHGGVRHGRHLRLQAGVGGEQVDDLALDQRGVDVEHDQAHAVAAEVGRLDRDVEALDRGLDREHRAERLGVGSGHMEVDRRHRVSRHPLDAVDVRAGVGDAAGDGREGAGLQRRPDDGHVGAAFEPLPVVAGAAVDVDAHVQRCSGLVDARAQLLPVARRRDQDAQDEAAPQHDLLDVEDLDAGVGEGREDGRRDAGPVLAHEGDEQGLGSFRHFGHRGPEAIGRRTCDRRAVHAQVYRRTA